MKLTVRQSETLRDIRYLEMGGHGRVVDADEVENLCDLDLVEKQMGSKQGFRLTAKGWRALEKAEERLSLLVSL